MKRIGLLAIVTLTTGCATVGPVTVNADDTWVTVSVAVLVAAAVLTFKAWIEYLFAKRLERYKKNNKDS